MVGALNLERALAHGEKSFQPGLLAQANRGFLYIDEVNLLEDHLVDLLLDVAASGVNVVEREGLSVRHPAQFVLIGSGNPEEGELRPQLLDRFGLAIEVRTPLDVPTRIEVVKRRDAFERDPEAFLTKWEGEERKLRKRVVSARDHLARGRDVRYGHRKRNPALSRARLRWIARRTDPDSRRPRAGQPRRKKSTSAKPSFGGSRRSRSATGCGGIRSTNSGSVTRVQRAVEEVFGP